MTSSTYQALQGRMMKILSSPRLALALLFFLVVFIGTVSWFPWTLDRTAKAPGWATAAGLDRPYSSGLFLIVVFLLLMNTLACTIERTGRAWALVNGRIPERVKARKCNNDSGNIDLLKKQGFCTKTGPPYFKNRFALTKGWLFHAGLVLLVSGVLVQQAFHDNGSFELGEREMVRLSDAGVVFDRNAGPLAPAELPGMQLALEQFDPYLHQQGYAPDRASTLMVRTHDFEQLALLDRARGVSIDGVSIYQAIPFGLALNVEIAGLGMRSLHLRQISPKQSAAEFRDPAGGSVSFSVEAERTVEDPLGTGKLRIFLVRDNERTEISIGRTFAFGDRTATIISLGHWSGFTYSRSPGVSIVFAGFFLLLAGTAVMLVPAGIAAAAGDGTIRVYLTQDADNFAEEWRRVKSG